MTRYQPTMVLHEISYFVAAVGALLIAVVLSAVAQQPGGSAAEETRASSNPYHQLRRSEDRQSQVLAERYFELVKLQEWSDAAGKTISAKYIEHDPNMQWVKLEAVRGRGAERVVKQFQYPIEKLSRTSQARVRQIDALQKKLDERLAAEAAGEEGAEEGASAEAGDVGSPMVDERGREPRPVRGRVTARGTPAASEPAAAAQPSPRTAPGEFDPDPLGFAEMDLGPPAAGALVPGAFE